MAKSWRFTDPIKGNSIETNDFNHLLGVIVQHFEIAVPETFILLGESTPTLRWYFNEDPYRGVLLQIEVLEIP